MEISRMTGDKASWFSVDNHVFYDIGDEMICDTHTIDQAEELVAFNLKLVKLREDYSRALKSNSFEELWKAANSFIGEYDSIASSILGRLTSAYTKD